jgi:hypothetical protein
MADTDKSRITLSNNEHSNLEQNFAPGFKVERKEDDSDRYITLSIGPQHPGSGHMRIIVVVDGDTIVYADPVTYIEAKKKCQNPEALCKTYRILKDLLFMTQVVFFIHIAWQ